MYNFLKKFSPHWMVSVSSKGCSFLPHPLVYVSIVPPSMFVLKLSNPWVPYLHTSRCQVTPVPLPWQRAGFFGLALRKVHIRCWILFFHLVPRTFTTFTLHAENWRVISSWVWLAWKEKSKNNNIENSPTKQPNQITLKLVNKPPHTLRTSEMSSTL